MSATLQYIAQRIKHFRKEKGYTLDELANRSNLTRNYIWQLEQGEANISITRLEDVCRALGIDIIEVLSKQSEYDEIESIYQIAKKISSLQSDNKELILTILRLASSIQNKRDLHLITDLLQSMIRNK